MAATPIASGDGRSAQVRAEAPAGMAALGYTSPRWLELYAARFED